MTQLPVAECLILGVEFSCLVLGVFERRGREDEIFPTSEHTDSPSIEMEVNLGSEIPVNFTLR